MNAELAGLSASQRREALIAIVKEDEGGQVSLYGTVNPAESVPLIDAFQEETGIAVRHYRAATQDILQRVLQEHATNFRGVDAIVLDTNGLYVLEQEGVIATFETAIADEIFEGGVGDTWIPLVRIMRIPFWNTDLIPADQAPQTWEDVLFNYPGELIFDPNDWNWFGQITKDYFIARQGMTEDEVVQMFKESAGNAVQISGHSLGMQFVVSEQFGITAVSYHHALARFPDTAPVDWTVIDPVIYDIVGTTISECAQAPVAALLLAEFSSGIEGQQIFSDLGSTTVNVNVQSGWPGEQYDQYTSPITGDTISDEREKWRSYWDEIMAETGMVDQ